MVNNVLNSISKSLYDTFGNEYRYYVENMEQNTNSKCFHISVLNPICRSVSSKDYYRIVPCVIHHFTDDKVNTNKTCYSIGEQVLNSLEYLEVDGQLIRAEDMSYTLIDDVLQIFLTYRFWTTIPETIPVMEDIITDASTN